MSADDTRELTERWVAAWNSHDVDAVVNLLTDGYREENPSVSISGREAARADLVESFRSQPDATIEVTTLVVDDTTAALEYRMTGTMAEAETLADGRVVPGTGRRYDMNGCTVLWRVGDKISAAHHYYDRVLMREQIGLPSGPLPPGSGT